jgi:hypothetical protein
MPLCIIIGRRNIIMAKPSPQTNNPQLSELSQQRSEAEMRAKIAEANSRTSEAHARNREALLRIRKADKEIGSLTAT